MSTTNENATIEVKNPVEGEQQTFSGVVRSVLVSDKFNKKQISLVLDVETPTTNEKGEPTTSNIVSMKSGQILQSENDIEPLQLLSALVCGGVPKRQILSLLMMNAKITFTKTYHEKGYIASDGKPISHAVWAVKLDKVEGHAPQACINFAWNMINSGDILEVVPETQSAPTLQSTFAPSAPTA